MKKLWLGIIGLAAASTTQAAIVTLTFSAHEGVNGLTAATNSWALYATVSQGDNSGLFAYGVDLTGTGDAGGPTALTIVNRTPTGTWDIDDTSANYDGGVYNTKFGGFGTGRGASTVTGVVSGVQDLAKDVDLVRIYNIGQVEHHMDDFRPAPADGSLGPIPYKAYLGASQTDGGPATGQNPYGHPATLSPTVPAGAVRIASGTWTGTMPSIQTASVNTKASVWKLGTTTDQSEVATLQFAFRDIGTPPANDVTLGPTATQPNVATGGAIIVTGNNGSYSSEVDALTADNLQKGSGPIQTIGDEAGNIYILLALNGTPADIAAVNAEPNAVTSADSQFSLLHSGYDSRFTGGVDAIFKYPNIAGAKVVNFDFSATHPGVSVDQVAAVPEPTTMSLLGVAGLGLLARRRRNRA